jgi:hypothetical protein
MADKKMENWRSERRSYGDQKPKTRLDHLCKELDDLGKEAKSISDEQMNRDFIERNGRIIGGDWEWEQEESDAEDFEEEYPDVIETDPGDDKER